MHESILNWFSYEQSMRLEPYHFTKQQHIFRIFRHKEENLTG